MAIIVYPEQKPRVYHKYPYSRMNTNAKELDIPIVEEPKNAKQVCFQENCHACTENEEELLNEILQHRQQVVSEGLANDVYEKSADDNNRKGKVSDLTPKGDRSVSLPSIADYDTCQDFERTPESESPLQLRQEKLSNAVSTSSIPGAFRMAGMGASTSSTALLHSEVMINDDNDYGDDHQEEEAYAIEANRATDHASRNEGEQQGSEEEAIPPHPGLLSTEISEELLRSVTQSMFLTTAVTVPDHDEELAQIEDQVRRRIIQEAVEANVVSEPPNPESPGLELQTQVQSKSLETKHDQQNGCRPKTVKKNSWKFLLAFLFLAMVLALVLGIVLGRKLDSNEGDGDGSVIIDTRRTIDIVRERGVVRCGYYAIGGNPKTSGAIDDFNVVHLNPDTGIEEGFNIDQCRAMAIAVFGDPSKIEAFYADMDTRFPLLANHSVDMLTDLTTHLMDRDVYVADSEGGFTFSIPYLHLGMAFAGVPNFVDCADNLDTFSDECRFLRVCVPAASSFELFVHEIMPSRVILPFPDFGTLLEWFSDGTCNVVAADRMALVFSPQAAGYFGPYKIGRNNFSKEPISLVTRDDDVEWSNLVNLVVNLFFLAEAENISKENANDLMELMSSDAYAELAPAMVAIVAEFGNYGDLYEKHFEPYFPRQEINSVYDNTQHSGLIYASPFGNIEVSGMNPLPGSILDSVLNRGFLRCGVQKLHRVGFAEISDDKIWSGLDVEFCRALSGALFSGSRDKIVFTELGVTGSFNALTAGDVDVVAGARVTMEADYNEPTSGHGYSFSPSYFYDNGQLGHAYALMVSEEDPQWSDFVFWTVTATMHAEEVGIGQHSSRMMPVTALFGEQLQNMLQDCVSAVGSYGEIYDRTLESYVPRSDVNMLYDDLKGPLHYPIAFH